MVYRPDLVIDSEVLSLVSDISVLVGRIPERETTPFQLRLRHDNSIRTIHSTSAIEGNRFSLKEVTDMIGGKRVIGDPKDILEIKNAKKAYDGMNGYDPFSVDDLLAAHGVLMEGLVDLPGEFRDCNVGVYRGAETVHVAPEYDDVPRLVSELTDWSRDTDLHPLVMSCVFHARFEHIHPFVDGNGRMGRIWQSLILSKWKSVFGHLPTESWTNVNKEEYYSSLDEAHRGNVSVFVKFMLLMIKMAVDEFVDEVTYATGKGRNVKERILDMVSGDPNMTAAKMAEALGVSDRTVKRHLSSMTKAGVIRRTGSDKTGHWEVIRTPLHSP
jgi:Fic family protein